MKIFLTQLVWRSSILFWINPFKAPIAKVEKRKGNFSQKPFPNLIFGIEKEFIYSLIRKQSHSKLHRKTCFGEDNLFYLPKPWPWPYNPIFGTKNEPFLNFIRAPDYGDAWYIRSIKYVSSIPVTSILWFAYYSYSCYYSDRFVCIGYIIWKHKARTENGLKRRKNRNWHRNWISNNSNSIWRSIEA